MENNNCTSKALEKQNRTYYSITIKLFILSLLMALCVQQSVLSQQYTAYDLKAVYLFNFSKFVQWENNNSGEEFVIGVYGNDPFGQILDQIAEEKNKSDKQFMINHYDSPEEIDNCKILFVSGIARSEMLKVLKVTSTKSILTVGDTMDEFCESGGIINFQEKGADKIFEINNSAAKSVMIKISPKLLRLAKIVNEN
jgi:hypothetical protein